MSYVLEALRRAEAERHRGRVPGLDAQPLPVPAAGLSAAGPRRGRRLALAGLALAAVVLATWLAWPRARPDVTPPSAAPAVTAPPAVRAEPTAPPPVVRAAPPLAPMLERPPAATAPTPLRPEAAAPAPAAARVERLHDLPEATRRQLPPLQFGGATDSPDASARMLIINGQVWREGDEPAPGLVLERITLRSAQFRWRERRIEVTY